VPLAGGTPTLLASGEDWPTYIAVDAMGVYWTTQQEVRRLPLAGGAVETLASNETNATHPIALSVTDVYWGAGMIHSELPTLRMIPK
jgi:hypothetical protein